VFLRRCVGLWHGPRDDRTGPDAHPEVDFLYYNTDINAAGGLLYCLEKGMDIPGRIGLAGFNSFEVLDGLPMRIATMDSRRFEIGRRAAELVAANALTDEWWSWSRCSCRATRCVRRVSALPRALGVTDQGGQPVKAVHHLGVGRGQEERQNRPQMQRKKRRHKAGARCRV
jgi:hypothetical protein